DGIRDDLVTGVQTCALPIWAGHLVGRPSKGRLIPKTAADLLEQAVLAREMAAGRVEALRVPINCLDVVAQQVVALVAQDDWEVQIGRASCRERRREAGANLE